MTNEDFSDSFIAVDNSSLVDKVEANLVELLQSRKLKVGDVIPKEVELVELLGVSRTVIVKRLLDYEPWVLSNPKRKKVQLLQAQTL
jgi:DNA-binding transcriptional MocR family regulator